MHTAFWPLSGSVCVCVFQDTGAMSVHVWRWQHLGPHNKKYSHHQKSYSQTSTPLPLKHRRDQYDPLAPVSESRQHLISGSLVKPALIAFISGNVTWKTDSFKYCRYFWCWLVFFTPTFELMQSVSFIFLISKDFIYSASNEDDFLVLRTESCIKTAAMPQ